MKYLQDFIILIEHEEALRAVEKNLSGARPRELFEDVLEEVEDVYIKERSLLRDAKLEISLDTSFSDFTAAVAAASDEKLTAISESSK